MDHPYNRPADGPALTLFGGLELNVPAAGKILTQPKLVALLAYLAVEGAGRFVRRDRIVGLLWPELDQAHARAGLRRSLYTLRAELGDVVAARGDEELALATDALWCDVPAFDRAIKLGYLAAALELYTDELLPGFHLAGANEFAQWLDGARAERREQAASAAWALAERLETDGDLTVSGKWARRAAKLAGDDERSLRRTMALLERVGDRAGAVRTYEDFARRLRDELGVEPSPETQAAIARLRQR